MESTTTRSPNPVPSSGQPGAGRRWTRFAMGLAAILLLVFGVVPALQRLGPVRRVREAVDRAGIDATALIYTESDESSEAESALRNALRSPPRCRVAGKRSEGAAE